MKKGFIPTLIKCGVTRKNNKTDTSLVWGFTLIELLVVVMTIGLLSSLILVSITGLRSKSRDNERRANLKRVQASLELYYNVNRTYPITSTGSVVWYSSEPSDTVSNNGGNWIPNLAPNFMSLLPRDPKGGNSSNTNVNCTGQKNSFRYRSDGNDFKLLAFCSPENFYNVTTTDDMFDSVRPTWAWQVHSSPNSANW